MAAVEWKDEKAVVLMLLRIGGAMDDSPIPEFLKEYFKEFRESRQTNLTLQVRPNMQEQKSEFNSEFSFDDIYRFFEDPPPLYLNKELTACYVLSVLVEGDSYGSEMIRALQREYPMLRISDTILYVAFRFLESEGIVEKYDKRMPHKGRPRKMYKVREEWLPKAEELAQLWHGYGKSYRKV